MRRLRAYTTRKMPDDVLKRLRVLAAVKSAETDKRITIEAMVEEVLRQGLPIVEREVLGK